MLRLAYAAALVRMVNGAVDPSQKGKYAAPVMTLAKRMGIPAVLVDVRMAASHQEMPALALLRHASERALQWLFERYWHAQANQLRELRRGAQRAAQDLVRAEAARRVKAERANAFRKAERGKGKAKTRARNGGVHVEDEDRDEDDDDDSSGGEDDDAIRELQNDDVEGADGASRDARRTATNRLFAAASREDTETCAEALISVALDVSRAPDGEPPGSSPTLADWRAVASRLLKRWPTLDEAMLLKAADAALEPGSPSSEHLVAAATDLGDARARAATAAATLFAETSLSKTQKTQPPAKRKRASARDGFLTQKSHQTKKKEKKNNQTVSPRVARRRTGT
jgi:ribosomal biogenesis protein LAS1